MFLPFLGSLCLALMVMWGKEKLMVWMWLIVLVILMTSFLHHLTKPLSFNF
jgi:hypothetical protein